MSNRKTGLTIHFGQFPTILRAYAPNSGYVWKVEQIKFLLSIFGSQRQRKTRCLTAPGSIQCLLPFTVVSQISTLVFSSNSRATYFSNQITENQIAKKAPFFLYFHSKFLIVQFCLGSCQNAQENQFENPVFGFFVTFLL